MDNEEFWHKIEEESKRMEILGHIERDLKIPEILIADGKEEFVEKYRIKYKKLIYGWF